MKASSLVIVTVLILGSFVIGTRVGVESYLLSDAKYHASVATYKLKNLSIESCKSDLEFERDMALLWHGDNEGSIFKILWPDLNYSDGSKKAIEHAATYRKEHPTEYISKASLQAADQETKEFLLHDITIIEKVTEENAK